MIKHKILALGCATLLTACGAASVPDTGPAPDVIVITGPQADTTPQKRGFFGFLRGKEAAPDPEAAAIAEALIASGADPVAAGPSLTDEEIAARSGSAASTKPRLFGFLRPKVPGEATARPTPTEVMLAEQGNRDVQPSLTDEEIAARSGAGASTKPRFRLFGWGNQVPGDIENDQPEVEEAYAPQTAAGFGTLQKACGLNAKSLGTEVAKSPGNGAYKLYDTAPESAAPRIQYVTGFRDGCARQFTAALALFGEPVVHEAKRYKPGNGTPYSEADDAYERVKGRVCGVKRGENCPEGRLNKLGRQVALLTAYPSFGGTSEWLDVVLYKGDVAGYAVEDF